MRKPLALIATISAFAAASALAQQTDRTPPTEPPSPPVSQGVPLSQAESKRGPNWSPGNAIAKEHAERTGVSVGEATSEMRRLEALNRFVARLQERRPGLFSFVAMRDGKMVIGLTDPEADLTDILPRGLLDPDFVTAALSVDEMDSILDDVTRKVTALGFKNVSVGLSPETGRLTFRTPERLEELRAALDSGALPVDQPYDVETGGIEVTLTLYGSAAWNADPSRCSSLCNGTTGFSVMSTGADQTRYTSTAGHVDNARARFNQGADSTYSSSSSKSLGTVVDLLPYGLDVQLAPPTDPATNPPGPYFWEGTKYETVYGAIYPIGGILMCKFGRYSGPDCSTTEDPVRTWRNTDYGLTNLYKLIKPASLSLRNWSQRGDSGGPVYRGTYAAGWIHGQDDVTGDIYYTSTKDFRQSGLPYDLIVVP